MGKAGRIQHPQRKLAHASLGLCPDAGALRDRRQGRIALPSGMTLGAAFQVGTVLTNGPFVLSFPCQGAALFSPEKGTMGHCARQKRAPCLASSLLGSKLPLWVCLEWDRPSKKTAGSSCSHVSSRVLLPGTEEVQFI